MFRRRKKDQADQVDQLDEVQALAELEEEPDEPASPAALVRPDGPWDEDDAPDDTVNRVDLGGLLVPVPPDTEVRVDVNPEGEVVAATLVRGDSAMQVNVFAAPRTYGIWAEVREEIGTALRDGGGQARDVPGPPGVELHAAVPTQAPGQPVGFAPARFIGVDGPRWFLRALLTGPAASDPAQAAELVSALNKIVVVRGNEAMAVRDPLPLRLPKEVAQAAAQQGVQQAGQAGAQQAGEAGAQQAAPAGEEPLSLELPVRGPEITERR